MKITDGRLTLKPAKEAFDQAIYEGRLSANADAINFAGKYMYMCTRKDGKDMFKHYDTRQYLGE